jgi:GTP1/Obg family GTP-binding protein
MCPLLVLLQVNDYPFTTRGVTIGHITDGGPARDLRFQVMDTP